MQAPTSLIFTQPNATVSFYPVIIANIPSCVQVGKSELSAGEDVEVTLKGTGFLTMEPLMGFLLQVQLKKTVSFYLIKLCCRCAKLRQTAWWALSRSILGLEQNICSATQLKTVSPIKDRRRKLR